MNQSPYSILVAEDDPSMQQLLQRILSETGYKVFCVADGLAAIGALKESFDLVLTDLRMPKAEGMEVLRFVRKKWPSTPVIVLTAFGSIPGAVEAMRMGAFDYLSKPLPDPQTLRKVVATALEQGSSPKRLQIIAEDPSMLRVIEQAKMVAHKDTTVLILGESGTGKEVIARFLHELSPRAEAPFIAVNCAALAENLLESELFGHEKGSFTGASARHEGKFKQADEGTLFLDEVAETSPGLQAKLLRVLQEKSFERVGGSRELTVDVRIIAATNKDLRVAVERKTFREDLYYRLAVFPIEIPPLRERKADIIPLAEYFVYLLTKGTLRTTPTITAQVRKTLESYNWPGNVRELQNVIERTIVLGGGREITVEDLGLYSGSKVQLVDEMMTLKDVEKRTILAALEAERGNRRNAAKRLGIALRTLQYKIKEYGIID